MAALLIYKTSGMHITGTQTWRYEINNLETLSVKLEQPVSPMALPQEDSDENILVKMEGNSEVIQISWRIPEEAVARVKKKTTAESTAIIQGTADDDAKYESSGFDDY